MLFEKLWPKVSPQSITSNGTVDGVLSVPDASLFHVRQVVLLISDTQPLIKLQVNRIPSSTQIEVGKISEDQYDRSDVSAYLTAENASVAASEQLRPTIAAEDATRAAFIEEPALAFRANPVDDLGDAFKASNPLPTLTSFLKNGSPKQVSEDTVDPTNNEPLPVKLSGVQGDVIINADNLNLEVQLEGEYDAVDNPKPDSVGTIFHTRGTTQDRTKQTARTTAVRGSDDTDTVSQDVSIHDHDGNAFTVANPVPTSDADTHSKLDIIHSDIVVVEGKQDTGNTSLASIDSKLSTTNTEIGALNETVPVTDTASSGLNGRLQRIAQRLTTLDTDLNTFAAANHTDLGIIKTDIDSSNTKLDTLHTDNVTIEGKLDTLHADFGVVEGKQDTGNASLASIDSKLSTTNTEIGGLTETAPATDTASSGLNGRLQRIAQRLTTIDSDLNTFAATNHADNVVIEGKQDTGNASLASIDSKLTTTNTEIGATNETAPASDTATSGLNGRLQRVAQNLTTLDSDFNTKIGALTETAPATDTASSGLNGRLQRIAQRLTTLIGFYSADFGVSSGSIRVAAQVGNATGSADFNTGASGAQTLRTTANLSDGNANKVTSQVNGAQRALDVGVNVSGVQIDPRTIGSVATSAPVTKTTGTVTQITTDEYARAAAVAAEVMNTEWGQMFSACLNSAALSGTTETPLMYINNPNGSGKSVKLWELEFSPTLGNNYVTYRIYKDATITANGSAVTINGARQTGQNASVISVFSTPTTSSNGTLLHHVVASGLSGADGIWSTKFTEWLDPNHNWLITRQLSANATAGGVDMKWAEQ